VRGRGYDVLVAGAAWPSLPPSGLPAAGIPVHLMAKPWPVSLLRLLRRQRPDLVHAHFLPYAGGAALVGARPLIATAWGSDVWRATRLMALGNRLAVRRADILAADSQALLNRMVELGAPRERTVLLNWGVDLERFRPVAVERRAALKAELGLGPGPVVLSSRGLGEVYNPHVVLDAYAALVRDVPAAQLVIKHADETPPPLDGTGIHVVGRIDYERMPDYYRAADACVSIPSSDSSPRTVWEAMACGAPCVLSDLPWVDELIKHGTHALVVPVDAADVAGALRRLLTEPATSAAMSVAARRLVEAHRDERAELNRLDGLYRSLASASTAASSPASRRLE
jgi:glycosyltransferase involved in cell wall biosynthesis